MPWHHPLERAALADALTLAGPGAPTLCEGWSTEHLAAHVVLRESAPLVAAGIVLRPLAARTERMTLDLGERSSTPEGYAALVDRVRTGPAPWHPLRWAGDAPQLLELFVHTEDVRRGARDEGVAPRPAPPAHVDALWRGLSQVARLLYRGCPVTVVLTDGDGQLTRVPSGRRGADRSATVVVQGPVGELALHAFDRAGAAQVTVDGEPEAVRALDGFRAR
ncbi:TIGR03085 family metal-binding protein [Actinotalea sp. K2]|uniref:TIGR03085 family metal-binding protein n=1 Tax=Actinotalea sp. K2 TaxID=2939438 RepID=UPI002017CFC4|nr:TIGR03085 family metal-binding protein [Actinotalea sp. K2]MCL3861884.1 TIGR03085 family metal-binding protein [Actinotalea sp. K2]